MRNKIRKNNFRRRKIESCKSSETRFPEVSCRSEPSSRGERTFEVRIFMVEYVRIRLISSRIVWKFLSPPVNAVRWIQEWERPQEFHAQPNNGRSEYFLLFFRNFSPFFRSFWPAKRRQNAFQTIPNRKKKSAKKKNRKTIRKHNFFSSKIFRFEIVWNAFWRRFAGQKLPKNC